MSALAVAVEALLRALFAVTRAFFLLQALGMGTSALAASVAGSSFDIPSLQTALRAVLFASVVLATAGIALLFLRRLPMTPPHAAPLVTASPSSSLPRPVMLAICLVGLPAIALASSADLLSLWREIGVLLDRAGFWEALTSASSYGAAALLPILVVLCVPLTATAAAFFLIAVPPFLLVLLAGRRPSLSRLMWMTASCQLALVGASLLVTAAFAGVADAAIASMLEAPDAEVHQAAEVVRRAAETLLSTAQAYLVPALGFLAAAVFLRPTGMSEHGAPP